MELGKWLGGILGFMTFGPLGALAGYVLGSLFDKGVDYNGTSYGGFMGDNDSYTDPQDVYAGQRNSFLFSMLVMASYIIKADGRVMHSEMELVRKVLRTNFGEMAAREGEAILLRLFERRKQMDAENPMAFKNTVRECGAQIAQNLSYEERLQLLAFLAQIAKADGYVCPEEIEALREVCVSMSMNIGEVDSLLNLNSDSLEDAYKVLEVSPSATDDEVRMAYRRMAVKHHPDKVSHLGEDIHKAATEKFQQINAAKERIFKARGMK